MRTCASFDRGDSRPDRPWDGKVRDVERGWDGEAIPSALDMSERGRRDVGFRGRGKPLSVLRDEDNDDGDDDGARGRAKTPSSTNVGDGDATRLDSRLKRRAGLGGFASVARGAPDSVIFEYDMAVLDKDARLVLFESETVDPELGSLTT